MLRAECHSGAARCLPTACFLCILPLPSSACPRRQGYCTCGACYIRSPRRVSDLPSPRQHGNPKAACTCAVWKQERTPTWKDHTCGKTHQLIIQQCGSLFISWLPQGSGGALGYRPQLAPDAVPRDELPSVNQEM